MTRESALAQRLVSAVRSVIGEQSAVLHEPTFCGKESEYLNECISSGFVSSVGKFVDRFESELASVTGSKYAVATVNGTAALHIALKIVGVEVGDEVLVPAMTFAASANAVVYCGAIPHFVDSDSSTLGIDVSKLRDYLIDTTKQIQDTCVNKQSGRVIKAIVPVHTFGHPIAIEDLKNLADEFNIVVVEDAAESLGSLYRGKHTGTFGSVGIVSFNGNKIVTTGGGGAILTDDFELAVLAKHLTTTAKMSHAWEYRHDQVGYNYRMPNINAALGCAQLENLENFVDAKRELFGSYQVAFESFSEFDVFAEPKNCRSNYWLQAILLDEKSSHLKDGILQENNSAGIMSRPVWTLLNRLNHFKNMPSMNLDGAIDLEKRIINLPSSPSLVGKF
jgi:aminotransferase in exopolysaccharide biosynthesis